jgi:hypothetical protein
MKPSVEDWRAMRLQAKGATFAAKGFGRAVYRWSDWRSLPAAGRLPM